MPSSNSDVMPTDVTLGELYRGFKDFQVSVYKQLGEVKDLISNKTVDPAVYHAESNSLEARVILLEHDVERGVNNRRQLTYGIVFAAISSLVGIGIGIFGNMHG